MFFLHSPPRPRVCLYVFQQPGFHKYRAETFAFVREIYRLRFNFGVGYTPKFIDESFTFDSVA